MKSKNIFIYLVSLLIFSFSPAWAAKEEELLIERAVQLVKEYQGSSSSSILESAVKLRKGIDDKNSAEWLKKALLESLISEVEEELPTKEVASKQKIKFILDAIYIWRDEFQVFKSSMLSNEGKVLLMKWLLERNQSDQNLAAEKYRISDEVALKNWQGSGVYQHGAAYEALAGIAKTMGRPREEQIDLLKKGIQINLIGQKKYPNYDYTVSVDALFLHFQFVTGGMSAKEYVDDWIAHVKSKPLADQGISGNGIAGALLTIDRDTEAIEWADIYIEYQKKILSSPNLNLLRQAQVELACSSHGGFTLFSESIATKKTSLLDTLNKKLCSALSELK